MFCQTNYGLFESTERFDRTLTALGNHISAVCYEFGLTINLGKAPINKAIVEFASAECNDLPEQIKLILNILSLQYRELDSQHQTLTKQLKQLVTQSEPCKRLRTKGSNLDSRHQNYGTPNCPSTTFILNQSFSK